MISVIIPLDSKSKHCVSSIDSILTQSNEVLEILIVPTVGDKQVLAFAEEIAKDRRIVTILPQCSNHADAINLSISSAQGEFVHICTGREILQAGSYAEITQQMLRADADIACFGWQDHTGAHMCGAGFNGTGNMQAFLELILTDSGAAGEYSGYGPQLWNKVLRRQVFFLEDATITASSEAYGMMEPVWLAKLALNCRRAVFYDACLMKRVVPSFERNNLDTFDLPAFCRQEKETLAFVETLSTYAYELMLQQFFNYEIRLLLRCRENRLVKMAAAIESHLVDFFGVPYEEKQVVQAFIRVEHQQKTIAMLRRDAVRQNNKVLNLTSQAENLKADRAFLKRKTESQLQRIEGLEADRTFLKRKTESQLQRIEGLEADSAFLKNETERQLQKIETLETDLSVLQQRKTELEASLAEFQGSFLARTALKLNRLYRKICGFFTSI